ncbi:MAG: FkbM family methyltransferase [Planctomycetota bacterium]
MAKHRVIQPPHQNDSAASSNAQAMSLFHTALELQNKNQLEEAVECYHKGLALFPAAWQAQYNLGLIFYKQGRFQEALACYLRALEFAPNEADILNNIGVIHKGFCHYDEAIKYYLLAIEKRPNFAQACNNVGVALEELGRYDEALTYYRRCQEVDPDFPDCHNNIGVVHKMQYRFAQAIECFRRAVQLNPEFGEAYSNWGTVVRDQGDNEGALVLFTKSVELKPRSDLASNVLFTLNCQPRGDAAEIAAAHKEWGARWAPASQARQAHANAADPDRKLRIGYVSPDLRSHSVAYFFEPILEAHDPAKVELFAYAEVLKPDFVTARLKHRFKEWRSTLGLNDQEMAGLVSQDRIDILVDLAGHTAYNRLPAMGLKPAPVQVTYLGYSNTTGMTMMDYRLTDALADPPALQALYSEELVRLPNCFLCYRPPEGTLAVAASPAARGQVTFGSFNAAHKVNYRAIALWARILKALPSARLFLKCFSLADEGVREKYRAHFAGQGLGRDRVELLAFEPDRTHHLSLYGEVDIALDPFPYNGTTTTCEAAWMGVPTITLTGDRHVSRVGTSILSCLGLQELVAATEEEYVAKAVALAGDLSRLGNLRATLRQRMAASPLCDAAGFTHALECAYRAMWQRWCARRKGQPDPGPVDSLLGKILQATPPPARGPATPAVPARPGGQTPQPGNPLPPFDKDTIVIGRAAEAAMVADAMASLGRRALAYQYALHGLQTVQRGQYAGGVPRTLLNMWQAPSCEGLLLRQCLSYSADSSYFDYTRKQSRDWLLAWARLEPDNPEPFLRFGLLFTLQAAEAGEPVPGPALEALRCAQKLRPDARVAAALALAQVRPSELALPYDGTHICLQPDIRALSTYVLLEQGEWFEEELELFRSLIRPGDAVLDLGANVGPFALSAAQRVGPAGRVLAVEPAAAAFTLLSRSAGQHPNLKVRQVAVSDAVGHGCLEHGQQQKPGRTVLHASGREPVEFVSVDGLAKEAGIESFNLIKMDVGECDLQALNGAERTLKKGSPIVFYEVKENLDLRTQVVQRFREIGCESFLYCMGKKTLIHYDKNTEWDQCFHYFVAVNLKSVPRLEGLARLL